MHPEIKFYKSNWLVVSAWSYHTKVPGSNPTIFRKKYIRFFFCFPYDGPLFDSHGFIKIFFAPISHGYYIYKTSYTFPKQNRWMVKVYQHYHGYLVRNPLHRRKTGKRLYIPECLDACIYLNVSLFVQLLECCIIEFPIPFNTLYIVYLL